MKIWMIFYYSSDGVEGWDNFEEAYDTEEVAIQRCKELNATVKDKLCSYYLEEYELNTRKIDG